MRVGRDDRLAAGAGVAAPHPVDLGGRPGPDPLQRAVAGLAGGGPGLRDVGQPGAPRRTGSAARRTPAPRSLSGGDRRRRSRGPRPARPRRAARRAAGRARCSGLGTAPPNEPECRSTSGPWTSTWQPMRPRMPTVVVGTSRAKTPVSVTTTTSGASRSRRSASSRSAKCGEPDSSSPSTRKRRVTAGVSRPVAARWARRPSRWNSSWPLSSEAPRANSSSPRTVGSNGGVLPQLQRVDRLHVVVAVDDRDRRVRLGGRPLGEDGRRARRLPHLDGGEAVAPERVGQPLGAAPDVVGVRRVGADGGDAQPRVQVGVQRTPGWPRRTPALCSRRHPSQRRRQSSPCRRTPGRVVRDCLPGVRAGVVTTVGAGSYGAPQRTDDPVR